MNDVILRLFASWRYLTKPGNVILCLALCILLPLTGKSQDDNSINDSILLSEVVVTAQFVPTDPRETVNSVRVLDGQVIQQRSAANLVELLRSEPNFRVTHDMILGSAITINGLPSDNVKILVDGVPVIGRLDGGIDAGQLPLGAVHRVEIIEGAQSLIYGSSASAGVVNLLTRTHQLYNVEGEVSGLFENQGNRTLYGRAGADLGKVGVSLSAGMLQFEADQDTSGRDQLWNPKSQENARMAVHFSPGENFTLRATASYFGEEVENLGDMRRPQFDPYAFDDYYETDRIDISFHGEGWLQSQLFWQGTAAYNQYDRIKNSYRFEFNDETQSLLEGQQDTSAADGVLVRATVASNWRDRHLDFLAGTEFYRETLEDARIMDAMETKSGFAAITDVGVFGSLKYKFNNTFVIQAGARLTNNSLYGSALTPSVWLAWRPANTWSLKISYANGFRSPGLKELHFAFIDASHFLIGNPNLMPERSHNVRLELERKSPIGNAWIVDYAATGFFNTVQDRIILAEYEELKFTYQNLSEWRTAGAGVSASLARSDWLRLRSSLIFTGYFNSLSESEDIPDLSTSPDWTNDLTFDLPEGKAGLSLWHKWTGKTPFYFVDDGEVTRREREGWHFLNASLHFSPWKKDLRITGGVKNLLDVREVESRGAASSGMHGSSGSVQPVHWGRTYFVQMRVKLHSRK